jgi:NADH-quinone oxidoreductase subunit G
MSVRKKHRGKAINITIDGKSCSGVYGQTILEIARQNDIYIPTMCYLTKVSPIASCRMCVVEIQGVDGKILSCQEKAVDGIVVTTNSDELFHERQNIMKLYNVNHPLQCGVCDKSGECDLQNKTLEFKVDSQEFTTRDQKRKGKKWGVFSYDPSLCILCERCVHTCNEVIGAAALYIKPGGYNSEIDIKMSRCEQCAECVSVCPVGALATNDYKYTSNAWECEKIPATCAHCSAGCPLTYDVKVTRDDQGNNRQKILRVTNDFEFDALCGAGKLGFKFDNTETGKDMSTLKQGVEEIKNAGTIKFNSYITNEEAMILQKLHEETGIKLFNDDAYNFQQFMKGFTSTSGKSLYSADRLTIEQSNAIVMIGTRITRDNPGVMYSVNKAIKKHRALFTYMHPLEDDVLQNKQTQFIKYEAGSEEGVLALLTSFLIENCSDEEVQEFLDDLDVGYLSGESSVGEEELEDLVNSLKRSRNKTLVVGQDVFGHENAISIGKFVGLIDKYSDFKVCVVPSQTNTLGVSLICDLTNTIEGDTIGYNEPGNFTFSNCGEGDINIPALNQQEGTFVSINKQVVNTNVAVEFDGFCLNDFANEILKNGCDNTIDYTCMLPIESGFEAIRFDDLDYGYDKYGQDQRGYYLHNLDTKIENNLEEPEDIDTYNGTVLYRFEPLQQFNKATSKARWTKVDNLVRGSESFAKAAKIKGNDLIKITYGDFTTERKFKIDKSIKGTIAMYPAFDNGLSADSISLGYRFKQVKIERVEP